MSEKTNKLPLLLKAVFYIVVVALSLVFVIKFSFQELPENFFGVPNWEVFEQTPTVGDPSIGLILGYILMGISLVAILFFFVMQLIDNPAKTLGSLVGIALIAVVFLITWAIADGDMTMGKVTESTSKFIGGTLGLAAALGGISILAIVAGEVYAYFK
ncbi:MAG: hypothetical protein HOG05_13030 [Bacteroidetes bacterium]|jgi:hypothetical protein|nr:hypothetical protein [Bacteroidota bacterium]MBT5528440.1 hypothetical protein [Cytophagia bacterium]MBT3421952.1 hypothetical protein [Bacteroidota bacterium]MBT3802069.1 hypothetical protein [Bacteroidota bacterium]MBT3933702.1 hypothetical protein [Bacteroidota bacterium]